MYGIRKQILELGRFWNWGESRIGKFLELGSVWNWAVSGIGQCLELNWEVSKIGQCYKNHPGQIKAK